jgi:hypothetical protein
MRAMPIGLMVASLVWVTPVLAQNDKNPESAALAGTWTYRSFNNDPNPVGDDAESALRLIFAEAVFTFEIPSSTTLTGKIDWPGGGLDLTGTIEPATEDRMLHVHITGMGRPDTGTATWQYDYDANLAYSWPNGIDQVPALVGTVIRVKEHGGNPAGYVASFVAVKQP